MHNNNNENDNLVQYIFIWCYNAISGPCKSHPPCLHMVIADFLLPWLRVPCWFFLQSSKGTFFKTFLEILNRENKGCEKRVAKILDLCNITDHLNKLTFIFMLTYPPIHLYSSLSSTSLIFQNRLFFHQLFQSILLGKTFCNLKLAW